MLFFWSCISNWMVRSDWLASDPPYRPQVGKKKLSLDWKKIFTNKKRFQINFEKSHTTRRVKPFGKISVVHHLSNISDTGYHIESWKKTLHVFIFQSNIFHMPSLIVSCIWKKLITNGFPTSNFVSKLEGYTFNIRADCIFRATFDANSQKRASDKNERRRIFIN